MFWIMFPAFNITQIKCPKDEKRGGSIDRIIGSSSSSSRSRSASNKCGKLPVVPQSVTRLTLKGVTVTVREWSVRTTLEHIHSVRKRRSKIVAALYWCWNHSPQNADDGDVIGNKWQWLQRDIIIKCEQLWDIHYCTSDDHHSSHQQRYCLVQHHQPDCLGICQRRNALGNSSFPHEPQRLRPSGRRHRMRTCCYTCRYTQVDIRWLPETLPDVTDRWIYGDIWCQISGVAHGTSCAVSIWSIAMVGLHRFGLSRFVCYQCVDFIRMQN